MASAIRLERGEVRRSRSEARLKYPIYQVDAFTGRLFSGNPAAVVPTREPLADDLMQAIAEENQLSETAFAVPRGEAFSLRWFTPAAEVDLCGHATLATAFVLFEFGMVAGDRVAFETRSGTLLTWREGDRLRLDFPARPARPIERPPDLEAVLGRRPATVMATDNLVAIYETEADIAALAPDFTAMRALAAHGVVATAPGDEVDFVSRYFAPKYGIPEDPVTGSTHCTLTPYWARRLGKRQLHARQLSRRGGELFCEDVGDRVSISGQAVLYMAGELTL